MAEMWYVATPNITKSGFYKAQHDRKPPLYRAEATRNTCGVASSAPYPPPPPVNPAAVILGWQARLPANQARHKGSELRLRPPPAATPPPCQPGRRASFFTASQSTCRGSGGPFRGEIGRGGTVGLNGLCWFERGGFCCSSAQSA